MLFNIISIIGLIIVIILISYMHRTKKGELLIKWLCIFLLVIKTVEYIYSNLTGPLDIPVEISTITYFMFSIVYLFKLKKAYHLVSFFALISGIGFFVYYVPFGFMSSFYYGVTRHVIATMAHGILLLGGAYLFIKNDFKGKNRYALYIVMLMIICHASIFYTDDIEGITFIYFLIRPEFLYVAEKAWLTHFIRVAYYAGLGVFLYILVTVFFKTNHAYGNSLDLANENQNNRIQIRSH